MPDRPIPRVRPFAHDDDPMPQPPIEPGLEDCCGSGCDPCIFDIYQRERDRYDAALADWKARHSDAAGG